MSNICYTTILAVLCFSTTCSASEEAPPSFKKIKEIEGVYKHRFPNHFMNGEKYQSEDIIELVAYSPDSLYFRIEIEFGNGHSCGIYGIAKYNDNSFIYRNSPPSEEAGCVLKISTDNKNIKITDIFEENSTCSQYCGARGSLGHYEIGLDKRRKIKYLPKILNSKEYSQAVEEYKENN